MRACRAHAALATPYTGCVEAELPRSVRNGPLITVTCECGQRKELHYGERWNCEGCGRAFDTRKIPLEEYTAIRRTQLRYRMVPLLSGLFLLAGVTLFFAEGKVFGVLILVPFLFASWNMFVRPFFRSRYRRALGKNMPTWTIDAD
jgi:hypothetical protein